MTKITTIDIFMMIKFFIDYSRISIKI